MEEIIIVKSRWYLISSIFQVIVVLFIGYELHLDYYKFALPYSLAGAFVVLAIKGEIVTRWIITLVLAIAFAVMGIVGIIDNRR